MAVEKPDYPILEWLEHSMAGHGWGGRMFGVHRWLRSGWLRSSDAAPITVVALRRRATSSSCKLLEQLRLEGIPFQGVQVDILANSGAIPEDENPRDSHSDVRLVLSEETPWYTVMNLGAACAAGEIIIFLDGEAEALPGLLAAYADAFSAHPELLAARGLVHVEGLDECACQATGSFILPDETDLWPVDLDENMAVRAHSFFALGGFDESMIGGYGALDLSIRLFGFKPETGCQRYVPQARLRLTTADSTALPMYDYLIQRQRSWLQLNDSLKRYLELYGNFWREQDREDRQ